MRTIDATQGIRILDSRSTASLLSKVLWITTAGFLFTAAGAYMAPALLGGVSYMGLFVVTFGLIFAINFATRRSPGLALVLFYGFTLLMGVEVGPLIKAYLHVPGGESVVFEAALTTAVGMFAMGAIAQVVRFDYRRVYNYVFAALIGLVVIGVLSMFVHFVSPGLYAWATLAIFSVLLLIDFMRLRDGAMGLSPVQMALSIYLDALNIFIALLQIFGSSSGSGNRRSSGWR
ncbi:MAG TPA: Bax inhibitor-1 family protein [Acidobacteriaceae bacterium]|nr:Bax inhibitor-1 family protein [Acidobacteriaceae bacterium]